jgi:hypothetical protein
MGNTATIPRYFKGHLDEVRISNVVLSNSEFLLPPSNQTSAYWRFEDDAPGTPAITLIDSSTNQNNGTPSGGPVHSSSTPVLGYPTSDNRGSLEFDGIDDIVEYQPSTSLDFSGSFTVEFWMRSPGTGAGQDLIIDKSHGTGGSTGWFFQSRPGVGIVDFGMGNGTGFPFVSSNEEIFDDEWHHLAGSYDGNTIEFFVDGISQGTLEAGTYLDNPNPVRIGNTQLFPRFFKGHIDEVRISNFVVDKSDFLLSLLSFAIPDIASTTTITVEGTERFGIQYNRQSPGTTDPENIYTSENYSYVVELSIDLNNWTSIGSEVVYLPAIDQGNGIETVSVYLLDAFTPKPVRQFMRIRVLGL